MLTEDRVTGILLAHLGAFGSGELKIDSLRSQPRSCQYQCIYKIWSNSIHSFKIFSANQILNEILTSVMGHNSIINLQKSMT